MNDNPAQIINSISNDWDASRDLVVIINPHNVDTVNNFVNSGQQRIFVYNTKGLDLTGIDPRVQVFASIAEMIKHCAIIPPPKPRDVVCVANQEEQEEVRLMNQVGWMLAEQVKTQKSDVMSLRRWSAKWARSCLNNIISIAQYPSIDEIGIMGHPPCVIVAPGPSLDRNAHELKKLNGRAIIITVQRAIKTFEKIGVDPDFVVALDPALLVYKQLKDVDLSRYSGLISVNCRREMFDLNWKSVYHYSGNGNMGDWIARKIGHSPALSGIGSVSCVAFEIAIRWNCNPIIFVGMDLAVDEKQYAQSGHGPDVFYCLF